VRQQVSRGAGKATQQQEEEAFAGQALSVRQAAGGPQHTELTVLGYVRKRVCLDWSSREHHFCHLKTKAYGLLLFRTSLCSSPP
jgi:hypothetical protein